MATRNCTVLTLLLVVQICYAFKYLQQKIPNGAIVPHPCIRGRVWEGVGHENPLGTGSLNPFGEDFLNNGKVWTEALCGMDSDGDGKTNGEELGDPSCVWTEGHLPNVTEGLSHPGVCDPVTDINTCGPTPEWLSCDVKDDTLQCPAFKESETFKVPVRIPKTAVPPQEDTIKCMFFELSLEQQHHIVGSTLIADSEALHHILISGCDDGFTPDILPGTLYDCGMGITDGCTTLLSSTTSGIPEVCEHPDAGTLVGGKHGHKYIFMQVHWYNPELRNDMADSSGLMLYLTPKLRAYNMGVIMIGQTKLEIPPGRESTKVHGQCSSTCTGRFMIDHVNITTVLSHMHFIGKSQIIELRREGGEKLILDDVQTYDFLNPKPNVLTNPVMLRPGDAVWTTCDYKSTSRTKTTVFGDGSKDEMCFGFVTFYPKERLVLPTPYCWAYGEADICSAYTGDVNGCQIYTFYDPSNPDTLRVYQNAHEKCDTTRCLEECKTYVKGLRSRDPCYNGDTYGLIRMILTAGYGSISNEDWNPFFNLLDSCNEELAAEEGWNVGGANPSNETMGGERGGANHSEGVSSMLACIVVGLSLNYLL